MIQAREERETKIGDEREEARRGDKVHRRYGRAREGEATGQALT